MPRLVGRIHDTRRTLERRPRHDSVGAHHVEDPPRWTAPAEELSGSQPQEAPDAPTSFSDVNPPLSCAVTPHA
jgi:hypothetical protein